MADAIVITGPSFEEIVAEEDRETRQKAKLDSLRHANAAVRIIKAGTPRDTGALASSVEARQRRAAGGQFSTGFEITVGASRRGFNYLDVTRFGHRVTLVRPKHSRALKVHVDGRAHPPIRMSFVRGYQPAKDWVEVAANAAVRAIQRLP